MPTKLVTISVTQDDITHGRCMDCYNCPVARAIQRHLRKDCTAQVGGGDYLIRSPWFILARGMLPSEARQFILRFDMALQQHQAAPIEFPLELPVNVLTEGV